MKYIFIAFTFFACNISPKKTTPISTEVLDTITTPAPPINTTPALFETAFIKGTTQKGKSATVNLYGITIGNINIVSGQVIACDPLHVDEYGIPFTQTFPTGAYPVQLSIANVGGEETVAFARIKFNDEPVTRWQLALLAGQEPLPVGGEKIHGYGVDAGIGILMDKAAIKAMTQEQLTQIEEGIYADILKQMDQHYHYDWKYAMHTLGEHKIAAFTTGVGDGRYASYIGFDATGLPCRLVIDFGLFNWKEK
ncbi:DUF4241 domain-containing protein [Segetibacter sp. 3557_3]|uniref:DUF4241 domain-containing protein n=1 Tax=Segetibacter sp. 3557_3 TaxID=2547429 RepID=UPI001058B7B5|nr:DUF4241 domain-containing protein [Segetibacter sp. 3557_3]TDH26985.1 DUF4241 domain-containing protein [Segetibacter sp. 3557_3]